VHLAWHCFYRVTPSRQTNIRCFSFGSVPVTALLVYLFQLVPVVFTYVQFVLVTSRRFWIWHHLDYWLGWVGSPGQKPWPGYTSGVNTCRRVNRVGVVVWSVAQETFADGESEWKENMECSWKTNCETWYTLYHWCTLYQCYTLCHWYTLYHWCTLHHSYLLLQPAFELSEISCSLESSCVDKISGVDFAVFLSVQTVSADSLSVFTTHTNGRRESQ